MMRLFRVWFIVPLCVAILAADPQDPPGHLQPLSFHVPSVEILSRDTIPNPVEFFEEYVKPGIPVIFKGAAKSMPNFKNWRYDDYLREKYGRWMVNFDIGKYEDASKDNRKVVNASFRQFLNVYQDKPVYLVQFMVEENPMTAEVVLPRCLACGGYKQSVTTVPLFFSSGGTNSALHRDDFNNFACVFDGSKEWFMFDRKDFPFDYYDSPLPGYSAVSTLEVDMYKYPVLQNISIYHAVLNTGDCMFLPMQWPHHVLSDARRNMGVGLWWSYMHQIDLQDCPENMDDLPQYTSLGEFGITNRDDLRSCLLSLFMDKGDVVKKSDCVRILLTRNYTRETAEEFFDRFDINNDGLLHIQEATSNDLTDIIDNKKDDGFGEYYEYATPSSEKKAEL